MRRRARRAARHRARRPARATCATVGARLRDGVLALDHPLVADVRGEGLLLAIVLDRPRRRRAVDALLDAGFIVNDVAPDAIRLAPPLVLTADEADLFLAALPARSTSASRSRGA